MEFPNSGATNGKETEDSMETRAYIGVIDVIFGEHRVKELKREWNVSFLCLYAGIKRLTVGFRLTLVLGVIGDR